MCVLCGDWFVVIYGIEEEILVFGCVEGGFGVGVV